MELTFCSPVFWDWETQTMKPSPPLYFLNWIIIHCYLLVYGLLTLFTLTLKLTRNEGADISDTADINFDRAFVALINAVDFSYVSICFLIFGLAKHLFNSRMALITLFNKMLEVDKTLTGNYDQYIHVCKHSKN